MIKYRKTLLIVMLVGVLLLSTIGFTYAYFGTRVTGNDTTSSHVVTSASKLIRYTDLQLLENESMEPGWTSNKTLTVENIGTKDVVYDLIWQSLTNDLSRQQDLVYSITCSSSIISNSCPNLVETQIPASGTNISILSDVDLEIGEIHTYSITVEYIDQIVDQSVDMNKIINGKLGAFDL